MHDERENKISLLKYEVCSLLMVRFGSKRFGYGSITVIKLLVRFANHFNGSVNFNSVWFGSAVRFGLWFFFPTPDW